MEKVKITKEQEKWLKIHNAQEGDIERYFIDSENWKLNYEPISKLSFNDLLLALNGWYEVEESIEINDWVKRFDFDVYYKVTNPLFDNVLGFYEKVTEPWKIKLLELGRKKPEFKEGDKVTIFSNGFIKEETVCGGNVAIIEERAAEERIEYLYPVESRIPFSLT